MPKKAEAVFKLLNGILCVYKPPLCSCQYVVKKIQNLICKELNNLETRPPHPYLEVEGAGNDVSIYVRPSYADNVLCVGPRYQERDVHIAIPTQLPQMASGVLVLGINQGVKMLPVLRSLNFTKCYHIKGVFGEVHTNYRVEEKVLARAKYDHVERYHLEKVLASFQASTLKRIIEEQGLDLQSEEAYEYALKGLHRPANKGATILYGLKVVDFNPPNFTIEVQSIFETGVYLQNLIHNIGLNLKTFAACKAMRCLRQGCFQIEHTLLLQQFNLNNILQNMKQTWQVLDKSQGGIIRYENVVEGKDSISTKARESQEEFTV